MKYKLKAYQIWEFGQRKDAEGRPHQEDSLYPAFGRLTEEDRLFILCDGMGGHDAGEVASGTVCKAMSESISAIPGKGAGAFSAHDFDIALNAAYDALDRHDTGAAKKMGTTLAFLDLSADGAFVAHIGDSRVYQLRPGKTAAETRIVFRTDDHSLVNQLVKAGEITEAEARVHPKKNVITRAMQPGIDPRPSASVRILDDIRPGDYFYLCSDGMLEEMTDEQLCYHFSETGGDDERKVRNLRLATQENRDNHTAFVIHILDVEGTVPEISPAGGTGTTDTYTTDIHGKISDKSSGKGMLYFIIALLAIALIVVLVFFLRDSVNAEEKTDHEDTENVMEESADTADKESDAVIDTEGRSPESQASQSKPAAPKPGSAKPRNTVTQAPGPNASAAPDGAAEIKDEVNQKLQEELLREKLKEKQKEEPDKNEKENEDDPAPKLG